MTKDDEVFVRLMGAASPWVSYVVSQAVQASLGRFPKAAVAVSVFVDGLDITLTFQVLRHDENVEEEIRDVWVELEVLLDPPVVVRAEHTLVTEPDLRDSSPARRYIYLRPRIE